jgi:hypothetical protein
MNNELIISKKGSDLIYYFSYLQLIVCFFSIYYKIYDCSTITIVTFYTSTNYWKNPIQNSYRRFIDIVCVILGIIYHGYIIKDYDFSNKYYMLIGMGSLLYPIGFYFNKNNTYTIAINHCLLQLIADLIAIDIYKNMYNINK